MIHKRSSISFPKDMAAHPHSNLEWWYCYAFLSGNRGNRYALMSSFFRVGELPILKGHYLISSFIDLQEKKAETGSYLDRMLGLQMAALYLPWSLILNPMSAKQDHLLHPHHLSPPILLDTASVQTHPTRLTYGSSDLSFKDDNKHNFDLILAPDSRRITLHFIPVKPTSVIDEEGNLNGLQYYSVTRNQVTGEVSNTKTGTTETVTGEGWFDHQWGRDYSLFHGKGWDWFGLQLEDGRDLLINRLYPTASTAPLAPVAIMIGEDGVMSRSNNVILKPITYWKSIYTGISYPIAWRIELPELLMQLQVTALFNNQEIPVIGPIKAIWEGACRVAGVSSTQQGIKVPITGHGFLELVGYSQRQRLQL